MNKAASIHFLKEGGNRVPGTPAYNRLLALITRMSSETIDIGMNNAGGLDLEVIPSAVSSSSFAHSFQGTIDEDTLTVSAGKVRLPTAVLSAAEATFSIDDTEYCYYVECTSSSAEVKRASSFPNILDASASKMYLPLFTASEDGIVYRHIGDYSFAWLPYFWLPSYSASKAQVLYHGVSGAPSWIDTGECDD